MARITKEKIERREQFIDIAQQLFLSRGYDKTAVSDIVKSARVAQGTFYYHFKSKSDVLEAVSDRFMASIEKELQEIWDRKELDPVSRLNAALNSLLRLRKEKKELIEFLHQESNAVLYGKIMKRFMDGVVPVMAAILEKGAAERRFQISFPLEAAEYVVNSVQYLAHFPKITQEFKQGRLRSTLESLINRFLGLSDHEIRIVL